MKRKNILPNQRNRDTISHRQTEEVNVMGEWSPSHLVVAAIAVATIIGQLLIVLTRLKTCNQNGLKSG